MLHFKCLWFCNCWGCRNQHKIQLHHVSYTIARRRAPYFLWYETAVGNKSQVLWLLFSHMYSENMHICAMQHMFDYFTTIKNSYVVNQFDKFFSLQSAFLRTCDYFSSSHRSGVGHRSFAEISFLVVPGNIELLYNIDLTAKTSDWNLVLHPSLCICKSIKGKRCCKCA